MYEPIIVHKGRTITVQLSLGVNVSSDTFVSQIRAKKDRTSTLLATWAIQFLTDGTDGELLLTLDDSDTVNIEQSKGYMDVVRMTGGQPVPAFNDILEVIFRDTVSVPV
jgi:hypothetical protein